MNYRPRRLGLALGLAAVLVALGGGLARDRAEAQTPVVSGPSGGFAREVNDRSLLSSPTGMAADGQDHVVLTYASGLIAIVSPGAIEANRLRRPHQPIIRLYRLHTDGTVEEITRAEITGQK